MRERERRNAGSSIFSKYTYLLTYFRERIGLVINDIPTVESKAPSQFGGVLLASARHAPLAPDKGYNTHDTLSLVYTAA